MYFLLLITEYNNKYNFGQGQFAMDRRTKETYKTYEECL